ncbi:hypothetical protein [Nannocystis pusilla]|uniref:hypothetical protein n=1 Tax=Nannocystis pusilla TaxID=889268 RepID=UPI003DA1E59B
MSCSTIRCTLETGGRPFEWMRCLTEPADEDELPELPWQVTHDDSIGPVPDSMAPLGEDDGALELPAGTYEIWVRRRDEAYEEGASPESRVRRL